MNSIQGTSSNDIGEFTKMLSYFNNTKNYTNDYQNNMNNTNNTNSTNPLVQMFQYLQTQGGNMNTLLQSITNNNTAFQSNRMNHQYNMDQKGIYNNNLIFYEYLL